MGDVGYLNHIIRIFYLTGFLFCNVLKIIKYTKHLNIHCFFAILSIKKLCNSSGQVGKGKLDDELTFREFAM